MKKTDKKLFAKRMNFLRARQLEFACHKSDVWAAPIAELEESISLGINALASNNPQTLKTISIHFDEYDWQCYPEWAKMKSCAS